MLGVGVVGCGRSERGESNAGSFEIHKSLKSSRRLGSLVEPVSPGMAASKRSGWHTSLLLATHPLTISGVNSSITVLSCDVSVHSGPQETMPRLGPKRVSCFFGGFVESLAAVSFSLAPVTSERRASCRGADIAVAARES